MHVLPMVILYTDSFSSRISDMLTTLSPDPPYVILNGPNQIPTMPSHAFSSGGFGYWGVASRACRASGKAGVWGPGLLLLPVQWRMACTLFFWLM